MKKQKISSKLYNWLKDAGLKAIVILLVVAGGFYAYAQISWPVTNPNPVTGVVGMFVGESTSAFSAATTGYDKVNDLCAANPAYIGSHVCSSAEMMNSYNHGTVGVAPIYTYNTNPTLWINNGPPGYVANSNDCMGWTATDKGTDPQNPNYGAMWVFAAKAGGLSPCAVGRKFACCK
jgi:hypothetical protein